MLLDPWQRLTLDVALGERSDGQWSAFEVGLVVPRQNGKGSVLEARELAGLYLFGEQLILHSAHEFKTAAEAFLRVKSLIDNTDDLRRKVARVRTSHGEEGIELLSGARLRFVARSRGSGRGFSGDCVILDEAYALGAEAMGALLPTLSARPNPQVWYASSAPMTNSVQLHAVRERALKGGSERLAYLEWSIDPERDDRNDPSSWARANPSFGIRISAEFVRAEIDAMPAAEFDRERLGVPDRKAASHDDRVLPLEVWQACVDRDSQTEGRIVLAIDMPPDRGSVTLCVGGRRDDGLCHVEVIDRRTGTRWLQKEVARLVQSHDIGAVVIAPGGPAGGVLPDVQAAAGDLVRLVSSGEFASACQRFYDLAIDGSLRHLGQDELDVAVAAAHRKFSGDSFRWARRSMDVDISPLCAASIAAWAVDALPAPEPADEPPAPFAVFA